MTGLPRLGQEPVDVQPDDTDERYWSVTTTIGALDKPALIAWAAKMTAEAAVDGDEVWHSRLEREGRASAVKWLKDARFRSGGLLSASELGTIAHGLFQDYALHGRRPAIPTEHAGRAIRFEDQRTLTMMLDQFDRFLFEFQPSYIAAEVTLYSRRYGYAGTADGFFTIDGVPLIFDYKTSRDSYDFKGNPKGPYPEVALQLAAYRYADLAAVWRARRFESFKRRYYLLSKHEADAGVAVPEVEGGVAIYITPEQYGVYPVRCDPSVFEAYLFVLEAARWSFQTSKRAIGNQMMPPHPDDSDPFVGLPQEA